MNDVYVTLVDWHWRGKCTCLEKNQSWHHIFLSKSHKYCPDIEPGSPQ